MASGYGKDQNNKVGILNYSLVKSIQSETCRNKLNSDKNSPINKANMKLKVFPRTYTCAQGISARDKKQRSKGKIEAACEGDAGSPMVCYPTADTNDGVAQIIQTGITSMGLTCGAPKVPGIYTTVARISYWVYKTAKPYGFVQFRSKPDDPSIERVLKGRN